MIKYVCVATEMKLYLPYLKQLLPELVVLGLNTKWDGFITKYKLLREYLSTPEIQDDDIICFIDAYDVLPTKNIALLETKYQTFMKEHPDIKIIVGYDKVDNFIHEYLCRMTFGTVNDIRLNSGQFIGTAKNIREIITHILDTTAHFQTDQIELTKYANKNKTVYIDINEEFFYVKSLPLQQVLLPKIVSINAVAFIHANGNGCLEHFLYEEHNIQVQLKERWFNFLDNVKGVLRKIIIYDLINLRKMYNAFIKHIAVTSSTFNIKI